MVKCTQYLVSAIALTLLSSTTLADTAKHETRLKLGLHSHSGTWSTDNTDFDGQDFSDTGSYFGLSLRNRVGESKKHFIGVGIDIDTILGDQMLGYRAIDYQYALFNRFRIGTFIGAATIDTGFPQNGYYTGLSVNYYFLNQKLGVAYEARIGSGLARDRKQGIDEPATEPNPAPDIFLNFQAHNIVVSWAI